MDSSNLSLDLTSEIEGLSRAVVESAPLAAEAGRLPPVSPLSVIGVDEVAGWREKVSDFDVDEVPVYEGFFESGFRDRVPSLVAKVSEALGISPGQLNLPSWRALIAMQNLGDLEGLVIEVAEVLYSYSISPLNGGEGRYHLHPRNRDLPEIPKNKRKRHPAKRASPSKNDDEVQFIKSNKRQAVTALASSSKKRSKASGSTLKVSPSSSSDPATILANLNTKVFPLTPVSLPEDSLAAIQSVQSDLLQKDNVLAKEKEIKALKLRVRKQHEAGMLAASENVSLREQLERREEEICDLRCAAETFDVENAMAMNGTIMVTRWELMREWLNHQTDSWDLEVALEQYKMVKTSEAELQGLLIPSFEGEPSIPSKTEAEKTPEPTADDPLAD
ncbi:hypothetical protein HID58_066818 [Brassica napus]|uniref:Uncharacterized protein n=1 Tax=Brassica napus TaxID=3708 RepID=A0ABQ7ZGT0_BRANA|nr:hypothetical protein HID58_066818 [Brassica napus]